MPAAIGHYLKEIHRLLKPGAKCFSTFFLLDDEARALIEDRRCHVHFKYTDPDEGWMALRGEWPERRIAFPEEVVLELFDQSGLTADGPIRKGFWCGRQESFGFQDAIICHRGE